MTLHYFPVTAEVSRQGTLVLRDVRASDAGRYGCVMTNGFTQAVAYADLTVEGKYNIPLTVRHYSDNNAHAITLVIYF